MAMFHNSFHRLPCFWLLPSSACTQRENPEECTKVHLYQEFITFLCLFIVSLSLSVIFSVCIPASVSLLSLQFWSHFLRPEVAAGCFFVTLYSWTTPFCSSSGGGCQETTMAVPLSPLSVTVTSRGGALGAEGCRQKIKKHTFIHTDAVFFPITRCSLSLSPLIPFSCQN